MTKLFLLRQRLILHSFDAISNFKMRLTTHSAFQTFVAEEKNAPIKKNDDRVSIRQKGESFSFFSLPFHKNETGTTRDSHKILRQSIFKSQDQNRKMKLPSQALM